MKKSNVTVIVPIHELTEETKPLFAVAVQSIAQQTLMPDEVLIVTPAKSETLTYLKDYDFGTIKSIVRVVENEGETDFCSQFNLGVSEAKTEFVSLLEYDDEYAKIWFKNAAKYMEAYPEVDIFLPIIADVDGNGQFIGTTNEAVWAYRFSDEMGLLDSNSLLAYQNFNIDGMVIRKSLFDEFGGFKSAIKLTFIYEFLLRMVHNDVKVMTIPRFGYKHVNMRDGSLFHTYSQEMDPVESKWWLDKAKKEFYFTKSREITYEK
jgi:glycosyltransferase involved in cell wall biosynthesis